MDIEEERLLIERARTDSEAFGVLFDLYYPKIWSFVFKRTAHGPATADIVSEVFLKAHTKLWQFKWRSISFGAWLYRIASNEVSSYFRNSAYKTTLYVEQKDLEDLAGFVPGPEVELQCTEDDRVRKSRFRELQTHLAHMPAKYADVIVLRYFEKKSLEEIASLTGKKVGTIKSLLSRGVKMLAARMQPITDESVLTTEIAFNYSESYEVRRDE